MAAKNRREDLETSGSHNLRAWWKQIPPTAWTVIAALVYYSGDATVDKFFDGQVSSRHLVNQKQLDAVVDLVDDTNIIVTQNKSVLLDIKKELGDVIENQGINNRAINSKNQRKETIKGMGAHSG